MFVDFNKTFNKKKQNDIKVPNAFAQYLGEDLPKGMEYHVKDNTICAVPKEGEDISFEGVKIVLTEEQKKILGENPTKKEIMAYSYNSQCAFRIESEGNDNKIKLNGKDFSLDKLAYNPMLPIKKNSKLIFMSPEPFPEAFSIDVGNGEYSKKLIINRIPNQSVYIAKYRSEDNKPLYVEYLLDNKNYSISHFKMSLNLLYVETIRDIVETTSIFNAFASGNGYIGERGLNNICNLNSVKYDEKIIAFWKRLLKLEELLNIQFKPPKGDLNFEDMCLAEELYQNLVNKIPIRSSEKITSVDANWGNRSKTDLEALIEKPISLQFEGSLRCILFGKKINLPCIIKTFNSRLSKYDKHDEKIKFYIGDESPEKPLYTSSVCFRSNSELQDFKEKELHEKNEMFRNAKKASEYLK